MHHDYFLSIFILFSLCISCIYLASSERIFIFPYFNIWPGFQQGWESTMRKYRYRESHCAHAAIDSRECVGEEGCRILAGSAATEGYLGALHAASQARWGP